MHYQTNFISIKYNIAEINKNSFTAHMYDGFILHIFSMLHKN